MTNKQTQQVLFAEEEDLSQALGVCVQISQGTVSKKDVGELPCREMS